jgi:hypothetical protein
VQYLLLPAEQTETLPDFLAIRARRFLTPDFASLIVAARVVRR